jgi:hypothetical protein
MKILRNLLWLFFAALWAAILEVNRPLALWVLVKLGGRNSARVSRWLSILGPGRFSVSWGYAGFDYSSGRIVRPLALLLDGKLLTELVHQYRRGDAEGELLFLRMLTLGVVDRTGPFSCNVKFSGWPPEFSDFIQRLSDLHLRAKRLNHRCEYAAFPLGTILGVEELLRSHLHGATCPSELPQNLLKLQLELEGTEQESRIKALRPDRIELNDESFSLDWGPLDEPLRRIPTLKLDDRQVRELRFRYFTGPKEAGIVLTTPETGESFFQRIILHGTIISKATGAITEFAAVNEKEFSRLAHQALVQELFELAPRPTELPEPIHFGSVLKFGPTPPWPTRVFRVELSADPFTGKPLCVYGTFAAKIPSNFFDWQYFLSLEDAEDALHLAGELFELMRIDSLRMQEEEE